MMITKSGTTKHGEIICTPRCTCIGVVCAEIGNWFPLMVWVKVSGWTREQWARSQLVTSLKGAVEIGSPSELQYVRCGISVVILWELKNTGYQMFPCCLFSFVGLRCGFFIKKPLLQNKSRGVGSPVNAGSTWRTVLCQKNDWTSPVDPQSAAVIVTAAQLQATLIYWGVCCSSACQLIERDNSS